MTTGKQLSKKMLEIVRVAQSIKSRCYDSPPNEHVVVKMQDLVMLAQEAKELVDIIALPLDDDPAQLVLGRVDIPPSEEEKNGEKKDSVPEESKTLSE